MVTQIALDTNAAIAILNNQTEIYTLLSGYDNICLPVTVCGELIFGAKNSKLSAKNEKRYYQFISSCELLDINFLVAEIYASLRLSLKKKGTPIPENDIWIAAICISNNIPLCTFDKHFQNIKGITILPKK
jgi:tRNA(fMet)-specific endonuclease VapC